jgi:hypothetical protein
MKQIYDLLDRLKNKLRENPNVFTVTYGDLTEINLNKSTLFPLAHFNVTNAIYNNNTIQFTIQFLAIDIVDYNKKIYDNDFFYGNDNLQDVYNTQLNVVSYAIEQFKRGELFDNKLQLVGSPTAQPFKDRFENELAGWGATIEVAMPNETSIC